MALVGEQEACGFLGLADTDPNDGLACLTNHGGILRFTVDGHPMYPLFQFDVGKRRICNAMVAIMAAKPQGWSDYRLLHWLTTPHLELGCTPAQAVSSDGNAVLAAFKREIEPHSHG